ncbi:NAD(P)-dependent oxidoreductase [Marinilabilia sp.]|uniref:NAD(P)-dependent oxidoreductase n=1 Tax=Marinilabilia sp. TaxID=2021252 RepID=UPI0025BCC4C9|nr:NAD(P)-dependent oxidoreductase [Marinilabilia sp.]
MKKKIVITHQLPKAPFSALKDDFEVIWPDADSFGQEELLENLRDAEVVVTVFGKPFNTEMIKAAPKLKLIANYGAGVDNIDIPTATGSGIVVTNTPDAVTEPTAELAMGLILDLARRISELDRGLRSKSLPDWGVLNNLSTTLEGKTLGIVGMGAIGRALARRANAFGMKIIYHNRTRVSTETEEKLEARYTDLQNLLRNSDFVSLNIPLTPETEGMIGISELKLLKTSAYLINTARGAVLDQVALIKVLKNKEIAGAALDVYQNEPVVPDELLTMENVVVSPHVGSATHETREVMSRQVVTIIQDFFQGLTGFSVVNPEVLNSNK